MYKSFIILCCTVLLAACSKNSKPVVQEEKIIGLLEQKTSAKALETIAVDMQFWSDRLATTVDDMSSQIKLAS
ncbi:MAG TPA: hypothetical protein VK173_05790, partial [Lacibacter sp.]|nr:hypothetical protein [Lacibacter sp.]